MFGFLTSSITFSKRSVTASTAVISICACTGLAGTVTDADENFTLTVSEKAILQISYIGYKT
jgi:hypothetical protein